LDVVVVVVSRGLSGLLAVGEMGYVDTKDDVTIEGELSPTPHAAVEDRKEDASYPTAICTWNGGFGVHIDVGDGGGCAGGCHPGCVDPSVESTGKDREYVPTDANDDGATYSGGHDRAWAGV
jgi:hypothetical protein